MLLLSEGKVHLWLSQQTVLDKATQTCSVEKKHLWLNIERVPMQKQGKQSALRCVQTAVYRHRLWMLTFVCSQQPKQLCR